MSTAPATWLPDPATEPEALIREARRRRRRRYLAIALAITAAASGTAGAIAGLASATSHVPPGPRKPTARVRAAPPKPAPVRGPILAGADTILLTWPVGYPSFTAPGGPPAYL